MVDTCMPPSDDQVFSPVNSRFHKMKQMLNSGQALGMPDQERPSGSGCGKPRQQRFPGGFVEIDHYIPAKMQSGLRQRKKLPPD
jgi:hypothetical protein